MSPKSLAGPRMNLPIASYLRSIERDPELAVNRRSAKPLHSSPVQTARRLRKSYLNLAGVLIEDNSESGDVISCRVTREVCPLRIESRAMQCTSRKLLRQHESIKLGSHHKAASDGAHNRRII